MPPAPRPRTTSDGFRNLRQSCVPRGSQRSTIFRAGDGQRPGLGGAVEGRQEQQAAGLHQPAAQQRRNRSTSATCSTISSASTMSNRAPVAARPRPWPPGSRWPGPGLRRAARPLACCARRASMPVTGAPSRAIGSLIRPPPQPMSSSDRPRQRRPDQRVALPVARPSGRGCSRCAPGSADAAARTCRWDPTIRSAIREKRSISPAIDRGAVRDRLMRCLGPDRCP